MTFERVRARARFARTSQVMKGHRPAVADAVVDVVTARSRSGQPGYAMVEPGCGAIEDIAPDATAFPWRTHAAFLQWAVSSPTAADEAYRWIITANQALAPHSTGAYLNHVEPTDTVERCFAHNYPRLQLHRQITDPNRRLRWGING